MNDVREVLLLEHAERDLVQGKDFYESRQKGIGKYFSESLLRDIEILATYGGIHEQHLGFYRMLAKRFPYAIYYKVSETKVTVYAVLPVKRNPLFSVKALGQRYQ